jgi:iron(III) transport system permease protein
VRRCRLAVAVILALVVGLPLALPFLDLLRHPAAWRAWGEWERLFTLARGTLVLVTGTLSLVLPVGLVAAVLLYRTDLPLHTFLRRLTLLTLFVPLPVFASGWQAALGSSGWLRLSLWNAPLPGSPSALAPSPLWTPWGQGLAAIWIHAMAAFPWVVLLIGQGLCWVERDLEEDALTVGHPWKVFRLVTLRRARVALAAAVLWVTLQTATEITITDMFQVRTFAEEVYTQFVRPDIEPGASDAAEPLARAVAISVPAVLVLFGLLPALAWIWERRLPPLTSLLASPLRFPLGRARWPAFVGTVSALGLFLGVPLLSLVWKLGLAGTPPEWSSAVAWHFLHRSFHVESKLVLDSLLAAGLAGFVLAGIGLLSCWLALGSDRFRSGLLGLIALAWVLPGPVVGIGLKQSIQLLCDATGSRPLAVALYYGPSPLPVLWAYVLRFFPFAVALIWPALRLMPAELRESALVDGARVRQQFWYVILPLTWLTGARAGLAVAILCLGELSAGKLVETPGSYTLAHEIFTQMHYGVGNDLSALCLLLLIAVAVGAGVLMGLNALLRRRLARWTEEQGSW